MTSLSRRKIGAALVVAAALAVLGGAFLAARAPVRAQAELPCGMTADRTVSPAQVVQGERVQVRIEVNGTCAGGPKGIDVFLVVDRSVTMFDKGYLDPTKDALMRFVNAMDFTKSKGGLITFASSENVGSNLTSDRDSLLQAIRTIRLSQETDVRGLQGAFRTATQKLDNDGAPGNERVIIIVVAGPDVNQALLNMPTVTQAARNAGVKVVFLMFPDSQYVHYIEAASDCTGSFCGLWGSRSGTLSKWAWGVDKTGTADDIDERFKILIDLLLREPSLTGLGVNDSLYAGVTFVAGSASPPARILGGGADLFWDLTAVPPGGLVITYEVTADDIGRYRTAVVTRLEVALSDNTRTTVALPNPEIEVLDPALITPTVTITPSPTATEPATSTPTQPAVTDTPTPTPSPTPTEPPALQPVFLPWTHS